MINIKTLSVELAEKIDADGTVDLGAMVAMSLDCQESEGMSTDEVVDAHTKALEMAYSRHLYRCDLCGKYMLRKHANKLNPGSRDEDYHDDPDYACNGCMWY